jgi:hypothetical protein
VLPEEIALKRPNAAAFDEAVAFEVAVAEPRE